MRTRLFKLLPLAIALIANTACGDDDTPQNQDPDGGLEVFSWWTSGGERQAFDALVSEFRSKYPKVTVINAAQANPEAARTLFEARMKAGDPPDTFQALAGNGVSQWVGKAAAENKVTNLDELAATENWKGVFQPELLESASVNGSVYAVPLNVHRINAMLFSPKVFADAGLSPPATIDELKSVCKALMAKGIPALSLAARHGWAVSLWVLDGVFPAVAGAAHSRAFLRGELSGSDAKFRETLELTKELIQYSNQDRDALEWDQAAALVSSGKAAMNPMGDWAYAELKVRGAKLGTEFDVMIHPGTQGIFMLNSDTFPMTVGAKNPRAAQAWLRVVGSERGQTAFNLIKGSIPARTITDTTGYDAYAMRSLAEFAANDTVRVFALSSIVPVPFEMEMNEQVRQFVITGNVAVLATWFEQNYSRLAAQRTTH